MLDSNFIAVMENPTKLWGNSVDFRKEKLVSNPTGSISISMEFFMSGTNVCGSNSLCEVVESDLRKWCKNAKF